VVWYVRYMSYGERIDPYVGKLLGIGEDLARFSHLNFSSIGDRIPLIEHVGHCLTEASRAGSNIIWPSVYVGLASGTDKSFIYSAFCNGGDHARQHGFCVDEVLLAKNGDCKVCLGRFSQRGKIIVKGGSSGLMGDAQKALRLVNKWGSAHDFSDDAGEGKFMFHGLSDAGFEGVQNFAEVMLGLSILTPEGRVARIG